MRLVHDGVSKELVLYCVKRTLYTYAVRFTQYANLYDYLRPTVLAEILKAVG